MFINFKNFTNELDMYNDIINATENRAYVPNAMYCLDGYYVQFKSTESSDTLYFVLRATDDGCAIYPTSADYEGQHLTFGHNHVYDEQNKNVVSFDELVKCINNFFYEVE